MVYYIFDVKKSVVTGAEVVNTGCLVEAGEAALVVLPAARVVHLDMFHVHLGQLVDRLLDLTGTTHSHDQYDQTVGLINLIPKTSGGSRILPLGDKKQR